MVKSIKGKTSLKLLIENKALGRAFWGHHMWERGYFNEVIIKYIEQQNLESPDGDFKTEDDL